VKSKKEHLGVKVKRIRGFRGMTQEQLAEAVGKTRSLISFYERTGNINRYTLMEIANALQISPEELESFNVDGNANIAEASRISLDKNDLMQHLLDQQRREIDFLKDTIAKQWQLLNELSKSKS
jgi:transcriptional regulator with XRE-family HTH domain